MGWDETGRAQLMFGPKWDGPKRAGPNRADTGRRCSRNKNGQPHQHNCHPVLFSASPRPLSNALPRLTPRPLQADPAAPSTATTPPRPFHLPPLPPPVDLPAPDTIVLLEPLNDLLALLPDGAPPPVDGAEALAPFALVIVIAEHPWSCGPLVTFSRTKGEFNDNLLALLSDSSPGTVLLPTLATVTDSVLSTDNEHKVSL